MRDRDVTGRGFENRDEFLERLRARFRSRARDTSGAPGDAIRDNALVRRLFAEPWKFSIVQVTRLLHVFFAPDKSYTDFVREELLIRPHLSLAFPPSDVISLEELAPEEPPRADHADRSGTDGSAAPETADEDSHADAGDASPARGPRFRITVSIPGLYGAASPLPTFYVEDLLAEAREDLSAGRDFLDLVNAPFFGHFLHAGWFRYRPMQAILEEQDLELAEKMLALGGLSAPFVRSLPLKPLQLAPFCGLLNQYPRSAAGLQAFLSGCLGVPSTVEQCAEGSAAIPKDQRCLLRLANARLGEDTSLGSQIADCTGRITVHLHSLGPDAMRRLAGADGLRRIRKYIDFYCTEPLEADIVLHLACPEQACTCLGPNPETEARTSPADDGPPVSFGQVLGQDTWLGQGTDSQPAQAPDRTARGSAFFRGQRWLQNSENA